MPYPAAHRTTRRSGGTTVGDSRRGVVLPPYRLGSGAAAVGYRLTAGVEEKGAEYRPNRDRADSRQ